MNIRIRQAMLDLLQKLASQGSKISFVRTSKHAEGTTKPKNWREKLRLQRKRQRQARKANRGR